MPGVVLACWGCRDVPSNNYFVQRLPRLRLAMRILVTVVLRRSSLICLLLRRVGKVRDWLYDGAMFSAFTSVDPIYQGRKAA